MMQTSSTNKAVGNWLLFGVFMLIVQILLGGITRLSGSGLSITEWDVVTGTFPPLNETQWLHEFDKYKATPQYYLLNTDFTIKDFKFIFFLGMVSSLMGKDHGNGFYYRLCLFSFSKSI